MDVNQESLKKRIQYRALAILLGFGVPIGSYALFQYDDLLHLALRFPNWFVGIFAGPMTGLPLGIVIASFPILLAAASGASVYYAWKLWKRGSDHQPSTPPIAVLSKNEKKLRWILTMTLVVPIYSLVLVLRASGSYFRDGLVPFWVERGFSVERLRALLPVALYSLFFLACLTAWISVRRWRVPDPEPTSTKTQAEENVPTRLLRAVFIVNALLFVLTIFFIKFYGRR